MDIRIYTRSKMAADSYSSTVDRAPGMDFSQILSHSVAGQGRQGESDKYRDRAYDISRQKLKEMHREHYSPVGVQDLPIDAAQQFHQVRIEHGIPVPPKELVFDTDGELLLPADYPYAVQMKQALEDSPELKDKILQYSANSKSFAEVQAEVSFSDVNDNEAARARFEHMVMMSRLQQNN